jgi:hypothetical protein
VWWQARSVLPSAMGNHLVWFQARLVGNEKHILRFKISGQPYIHADCLEDCWCWDWALDCGKSVFNLEWEHLTYCTSSLRYPADDSHFTLAPAWCLLQPVYLHGSLGREAATGRGTVFAIRELLKAMKLGRVQDHKWVNESSGLSWQKCVCGWSQCHMRAQVLDNSAGGW